MSEPDGGRAMACLSAMREGRAWLDAKLLDHMGGVVNPADHDAKSRAKVRSDDAYHVAEFFYVARELDLLHRDRLLLLIGRHNADMQALLAGGSKERIWSMELSRKRVEQAIFTDDQQLKIAQGPSTSARLHLDQSDLGKLLSPLMSPENCRQTLQAMTAADLLKSSGYGRIFITSAGVLENYFRDHLLIIDQAIRGAEPV